MGGAWKQMKQFLVVVDMQKDFVDGSLGSKEAVAIIPFLAIIAYIIISSKKATVEE